MALYLLRRLGTSIIVLIGISIFIYLLLHAIYPSPARDVLGLRANNAQIAAWNKANGFDRPVIVQYLGDQAPGSKVIPAAGSKDRYKVQEWLNFITTELHKTFGPMFRPTTPDAGAASDDLFSRLKKAGKKELEGRDRPKDAPGNE